MHTVSNLSANSCTAAIMPCAWGILVDGLLICPGYIPRNLSANFLHKLYKRASPQSKENLFLFRISSASVLWNLFCNMYIPPHFKGTRRSINVKISGEPLGLTSWVSKIWGRSSGPHYQLRSCCRGGVWTWTGTQRWVSCSCTVCTASLEVNGGYNDCWKILHKEPNTPG